MSDKEKLIDENEILTKEVQEKLIKLLKELLKACDDIMLIDNMSAEDIREHQRFTCLKLALRASDGRSNSDIIPLAKKFHTYITTGE